MKITLTQSAILLLIGASFLQPRPCHCAVPAPGTEFYDRGNGVTEIVKKHFEGDGADVLGQIRGDQKFLIVRYTRHKVDLTVTVNGKLLYTMPDEDVPNFGPGVTFKGYDFYLSPDHLSLFVVRGEVSKSAVCYLYRRSGPGRMKAVHPGGLQFDDAALHDYCRRKRVNEDLLGRGAHMVRFVQWDTARHRLIFTMFSASNLGEQLHPGEINAYWYTAYDLKTWQFKIITHTKGLPEPRVG